MGNPTSALTALLIALPFFPPPMLLFCLPSGLSNSAATDDEWPPLIRPASPRPAKRPLFSANVSPSFTRAFASLAAAFAASAAFASSRVSSRLCKLMTTSATAMVKPLRTSAPSGEFRTAGPTRRASSLAASAFFMDASTRTIASCTASDCTSRLSSLVARAWAAFMRSANLLLAALKRLTALAS